MGGIVCAIPKKAVLRFESVPNSHKEKREFDEQIRALYANPVIANAVGTETQHGEEVCDILGQQDFTDANRARLLEIVDGLEY